jgi:peptide deformylase
MSVVAILQNGADDGAPQLRAMSKPIDPADLADYMKIAQDLIDTAVASPNCAGLAAPQIGHNVRMVCILTRAQPYLLMNPVIEERSKRLQLQPEGCLSVPPKQWGQRVERAWRVRVSYLAGDGRTRQFRAQGFEAAVLQHEIDHLNGVLFVDKLYGKRLKSQRKATYVEGT